MKGTDSEKHQALLEEIWPRVKRKHLYPEIPTPQIGVPPKHDEEEAEPDEPVGMEMKEKQIRVNSAFVSNLRGRISEAEAIEALLDHGITHYTFCPWDFRTHVSLYAAAKKVMGDKTLAKRAADYFIDIVSDTHCIKNRFWGVAELHRAVRKGKVAEVVASLYQRIWGVDLGVPSEGGLKKEHQEIVRRLARIPYLDRSRWMESINRFCRTMKPLLLEEQEEEGSGGDQGQSSPTGDHDFNNYTYEEIDEGMREYATEKMALAEFREVVEDFSEELKQAGYGMEGGMGRGQGTTIDADILFYMKLAENYAIPLRKIPIEEKGALHPHSHAAWEVGSPYQDVDVWTSFGKIMPGITQVWKKKEGKGRGKVEGTPDCLIVIDSSGSMINPRKSLSYAVLGAACATNAYLRNGAKVAVYNFSDAPMGGRDLLDYTDNREAIYRVLCRYFGGGTALDMEDLGPLVRDRKNLDLFIITDMKITNLEALIGYLAGLENRVTAVHIGENPYATRFEKAVEKKPNINIFTVKRKEDIPGIILGKIREYFHGAPSDSKGR